MAVTAYLFDVRVTLSGGAPNRAVARYIAGLPATIADDVDAMLVLFTLLSQRTTTAPKLEDVLQKPIAEVESVLKGAGGRRARCARAHALDR